MKKKYLLKKIRDLPEEVVRLHLENGGRKTTDYFLVGDSDVYELGSWGRDGKPRLYSVFSEDEVLDFAIEQYLLSHCHVYKLLSEVPDRKDAAAERANEA